MKWICYMILLSLALLGAGERSDVGKLRPVEAVALAERDGQIIVRADTGDWGRGESLSEAIGDLRDSTAGLVYLDTAEYLLLETKITEELGGILKPNVRVCAAEEGIGLDGVGAYLDVHRPGNRLDSGTPYEQLEFLWQEHDRYRLQ